MCARAAPPATRLDLTSPAFKNDPFPVLAQMRALGPVARVRMPLLGSVWMATTYEAAKDLLRDHHHFVQNPATAGHRWMSLLLRWAPRSLQPIAANMLLRDEPDHRRLRSLVEQAFLRQTVESLRPRLEALADEALDRFIASAAASAAGADLLAGFARPFPLAVICELLGLPPEDRPQFTRWASGISRASSLAGIVWGLRGISQMMNYLRAEIARQTSRPRAGLLAALIQAEAAGDRLSEDELVAMVFLLLAAGHETTLHQIAGSVLILLDHPQALAWLRSDWRRADTAVQELFRYLSFAQVSKPRYVRDSVEFHGAQLAQGQVIFAALAAANSDPAEFPEPAQLDLARTPNRHLAFGTGIHVCLGARLASVETEIALNRIFTRLPNLKLAVPRSQVRYSGRVGMRGLLALPVAW